MVIIDDKARGQITAAFNRLNLRPSVRPRDLVLMQGGGLMHDHVDMGNDMHLLRVPRGNQMGLSAHDYLALQFDIHARAGKSGHVPGLFGRLNPSPALPNGALVVRKINGRKVEKAADFKVIADALARIHRMDTYPVPATMNVWRQPFGSQLPLLTQVFEEGLAAMDGDIRAPIAAARDRVVARIDDYGRKARGTHTPRLIGGDSHPGNFMIDRAGKAQLVDMEFATFDTPLIDVADASAALPRKLEAGLSGEVRNADTSGMRAIWHGHMVRAGLGLPDFEPAMRLADDVVNMRTVLWLCDWRRKNLVTNDLIAPATRANWEKLADEVLMPKTINRLFPAAGYSPR